MWGYDEYNNWEKEGKAIENESRVKAFFFKNDKLKRVKEHIDKASNVVRLSLQNKKLVRLNEHIGYFINLTFLDLMRNRLTTLPDSIGDLIHLKGLYLTNNTLNSLPDSICKLIHLVTLYLNNNKLTSLPDSIGDLTKLEHLNLEQNQLTTVPDSIGNLTRMNTLYLNNNKLTSLPDSIGDLTKLETLDLNNNQLTTVPDSIGNLIILEGLNLNNNHITHLPVSIGYLTRLITLELNNNQLTSIPDQLLSIPNLTYTNNPIILKGYDPRVEITENIVIENRDPYYIYPSSTNRLVSWKDQGGGVKVLPSYMGCGLNVLSCLGFIDRNELPQLIIEQDKHAPAGLSISRMIEMIPEQEMTTLELTASFYRFFIPFGKDKEATIRTALNNIAQSLKLPRTEPYLYMIVKLIINISTGLGHTILVEYDSSTDTLVTFDPQNCTPDKTTVRSFASFSSYLLNSLSYRGLSVIKYKTAEDREGGRRKRKTLKGKRKTAKKMKKSSRNAGLVSIQQEVPFGISNPLKMLSKPSKNVSKSQKMVSKPSKNVSKSRKIVSNNDVLFNQLVEFLTEGEKNDKKTNKLLFEVNQSLKDWT